MRDLNLVVTTDLHSWIEGREHQPYLNATLGHAVSMVEQLKHIGRASRRDVFFFDNGDINDGTGLSATDQDHVAYLAPLMKSAPYDALNLGNHELYQLDAHGAIPGQPCAVTGLRDSGYIESWQGRYLTSNTVWADSGKPVGSRFTVLRGEFGTQLLVFGFMYNMDDHCDAVVVEDVASAVSAEWFSDALTKHGASSDAVVVLFHIDYRDKLQQTILSSIRSVLGKHKPLQFLTGHSHTRGFARLDNFSSSFEAGCKLNTLGFISFNHAASERLDFDYTQIDGNTALLAGAANTTVASLVTPFGQRVIDAIDNTRHTFGLDVPLGCAKQTYEVSAGLSANNSLWGLYAGTILPQASSMLSHCTRSGQLSVPVRSPTMFTKAPSPRMMHTRPHLTGTSGSPCDR
jgi:2',3'-cyclic-nucleotide 2'-phosphodiesterase (5'-nucleotidase family)